MAKKYVETYSSSNVAAQDPEEMVRLINIQKIHYKINSLIQKLQKKKKIERTRRLTDLECPKSPAQSLHIPSTSHNNPRTSQSCRQNNNFRLVNSYMVPSSSEDVTRAMRGLPKRFSRKLPETNVFCTLSCLFVRLGLRLLCALRLFVILPFIRNLISKPQRQRVQWLCRRGL